MKDFDVVESEASLISKKSHLDPLNKAPQHEKLIDVLNAFLPSDTSKEHGANGDKGGCILKNLDVTEEDEKKTGVRHRKITTEGGDKKTIVRSEDPLKSTKRTLDWWLTTIEKEDASKESSWEIKVADKEVIACIRETIYDYLVHTGDSPDWKKDQISLKPSFIPIILNWSSLKQISKKAKDENVGPFVAIGNGAFEQASAERYSRLTYERIGRFLQYVQEFRPRPIEVLEQKPDEIEFDNLWALFRPGKLVVTTWSQDSGKYPQIFKVNQFRMKKRDTRDASLQIEAWMFDWNGTDIDRTLFYFSIQNFETTSGASVKSVKSLEVYPIEYYTDDTGRTGIEAIYGHEVYQNRRKSFIEYAINGEGKGSPIRLQYAGDVLHIKSTGPLSTLAFKKTGSAFEEIVTLDEKSDTVNRVKVSHKHDRYASNNVRDMLHRSTRILSWTLRTTCVKALDAGFSARCFQSTRLCAIAHCALTLIRRLGWRRSEEAI